MCGIRKQIQPSDRRAPTREDCERAGWLDIGGFQSERDELPEKLGWSRPSNGTSIPVCKRLEPHFEHRSLSGPCSSTVGHGKPIHVPRGPRMGMPGRHGIHAVPTIQSRISAVPRSVLMPTPQSLAL